MVVLYMKKEVKVTRSNQVNISDRVKFYHKKRQCIGYVCKKGRTFAYVVGDDQSEYKVPYNQLIKIPGTAKHHVQSTSDMLRLQYRVNDRISFSFNGTILNGTIARLNPKRAHIISDDDKEFQVAYSLLKSCDSSAPAPLENQKINKERISRVHQTANDLLEKHHLSRWSFQFDHGTRRAGSCQFEPQLITLAYEFALNADDENIEDALLHEIAHALVGRDHQHDAVWQEKAREIGCSAKRCHDIQFTPPRYIVKCINNCWVTTCERKRRNIVCKKCHGKLVFITYTSDRFEKEKSRERK